MGMQYLIHLAAITCIHRIGCASTSSPCFLVGSFNVKWFNVDKSTDSIVMQTLVDVIHRYDVMLMMEIRDDSLQTAMTRLWERVNQTSAYGLALSRPLGRHPSRYSEQYGFFYRLSNVSLVDTFLYDDSVNDEFEREPYAVLIKPSGTSLQPGTAFIGVHIQPRNAVAEMNHLVQVTDVILRHWNLEKAVILGDMNADCTYMSSKDLADTHLWTDPRFTWLIPDTADTTVSRYTDCAYDRIIVTDAVAHAQPDVFNFDAHYSLTYEEAKAVSDHYPVEAHIC